MTDVLVVGIPGGEAVGRSDLAAVGFGRRVAEAIGGGCDLLLLGSHAASAAKGDAPKLGLGRILLADYPDLAAPAAETFAAAVGAVIDQRPYRVIAAANSTTTKDYFPRLAARLAAPMVTDAVEFRFADGEKIGLTKTSFSGNLLADVELSGSPVLATCRASAFEPAAADGPDCPVETVSLPESLAHPRKRFVELNRTPLERPELTEAEVVVSGGRGTRGPEGLKLVEELADLLGGAVGASRAAVDAGWVPNDFQVGQTGKVVAPKLYIACGISGAIQHLAGMRNSKNIVAINKDPNAPIFETADLGLVADLFEALPVLIKRIQAARAG